jgi:hemerythrin-like domain-containing protein
MSTEGASRRSSLLSTSSRSSNASNRPQLKLTTQNLNVNEDKTSSSNRYYAHLLYVPTPTRNRMMSRGTSSSASSIRSAASNQSNPSSHTSANSKPPVTPANKFTFSKNDAPSYYDEHFPLITTISPDTVPSHIPRTHYAFHCARTMASIHNVLIRCLNSLYNHALRIQPGSTSVPDFLHLTRLWCQVLEHHHHIEESYLFGAFEALLGSSAPENAMAANVEGHEAFMANLRLFKIYAERTSPEEFCGMTFRNIIDAFAEEFVEHLHEEIPTMLGMWRVDSEELKKVWAVADKMGQRQGSLFEVPALILGSCQKGFEIDGEVCTFPDAPWLLEVAVRKVFSRKHASVWRFLPCTLSGERKPIPAA